MLTAEQLFDEQFYLSRNADVADAVAKGAIGSGFQHFMQFGKLERRDPSPLFNFSFYQSVYADVADAVVQGGFSSEFDHFINFGQLENRDPVVGFDTVFYLAQNSDIASAVGQGLTAYQHYVQFGQFEFSRSISENFNPSYYLQQNPDVAAAVEARITSPLTHYLVHGIAEGRRGAPPPASDDLGTAVDLGPLTGPRTVSDVVGKNNTNDIYRLVLNAPSNFRLSLDNLTADADVELIQDFNGNSLVDPASEIVGFSVNFGTSPEAISIDSLAGGTYWLRVSYAPFGDITGMPQTTDASSYNLNLSLG